MSFTKREMRVGTHVKIALYGATLSLPGSVIQPVGDDSSPTTVGPNAKPDADDTAWIEAGTLLSLDRDPGNMKAIPVKRPSPWSLKTVGHITVGDEPKVSFVTQEMTALAVQLLKQTAALATTGGQYNPGAGKGQLPAWVKIEHYDNDSAPYDTTDEWGLLEIGSALKYDREKEVSINWQFSPELNGLATGELA